VLNLKRIKIFKKYFVYYSIIIIKKLKDMNYEKLMLDNPTVYEVLVNSLGQKITFIEHPLRGDEFPIIAVCHELGFAGNTGFFDLDDMLADHKEYEPWFTDDGGLEIGK
jgi:hypothetical protein